MSVIKRTHFRLTPTTLPVEIQKYYSRTYVRTGQSFNGLGPWLLYQERNTRKDNASN